MICPFCLVEIPDDSTVCPICGKEIPVETAQPEPVNTPVQEQVNAYPQPGNYSQPDTYQQPNTYQQPGAYPQANTYQQPNNYQQPNAYPQPGGYQQPGAYPQANTYQQPGSYQQPGAYDYQSSAAINEFAKKARSLKTLGIFAAILMFGIGIFLSIGIWVSKAKIPAVTPSNAVEEQMLAKAIKDYNLAKKLAILPVIALVLSFVIGFISGLA